jgi:hypothetical protein
MAVFEAGAISNIAGLGVGAPLRGMARGGSN